MPQHKRHDLPRLRAVRKFDERGTTLEECPNCHHDRIGKTPRGKGGPSVFHCRKCGFVVSIDQIYDMHRLLGHVAA